MYKRYKFASTANCKFIEVPADFIKNKTEVNKTGKKLGTILSISDINQLYEPGTPSKKLKYIMHSEPSLQRRDGAGSSFTPPLRWYDRKWTNDFIRMLTDITEQLTIPPAGVEIHPGGKKNTYEDLIKAITAIRVRFEETFNTIPFVVVENRTSQFIRDGKQICEFWERLLSLEKGLAKNTGIVLDISQLYTVTKNNFIKELNKIPPEAVKGLHIHYRHCAPSLKNDLPWKKVFGWLKDIKHKIFINPEVLSNSHVTPTISFCKQRIA